MKGIACTAALFIVLITSAGQSAVAQRPEAGAQCPVQPAPFTIYFVLESVELTPRNLEILNQSVNEARSGGCRIVAARITGHADTSHTAEESMALSVSRANATRDALAAAGIPIGVMTLEAKGETDLARPTKDGVREPLNRRAEVIMATAVGAPTKPAGSP